MCQATVFDELAAAMYAFGYWAQLEAIEADLDKDEDDVPNELLLRELAVLPLLRIPNPHQAPTYLFQDHGVLRFLGFTLAQSRLPEHEFEPYRYVRTIQGRKEQHEVELASFWNLDMWASYEQAWKKRIGPEGEIPGLWGVLIREERQKKEGQTETFEM